jgi:uridine phosphorylase
MPSRLRPTSSLAADALLVGDPGRALLLAQELLEKPKMSNHARGLWGYSGRTPEGRELTIQATGMGGPSAALVLADLGKLGVERAVRVGTCAGLPGRAELGELLLATGAVAAGGSAASFGLAAGATVAPDPGLVAPLADALAGEARAVSVASLDTIAADPGELPVSVAATDMQTVAVLARASELGIVAAAVLIVSEAAGDRLADEEIEPAAKKAGRAAAAALAKASI